MFRIASPLAVLLSVGVVTARADEAAGYWPQWRGPNFDGSARQSNPPAEWSETQNVRWKVAIPGKGHATPIIWGDRVFVQSAVPIDGGEAHRFVVLALDRKTGKKLWERVVVEETPHERGHQDSTHASASPVTDGEHLIAFFGSRGLYGLTFDGEVLWGTDFGDMRTRNEFGEGSSPALHGDTVVVQWDHEGDDFIVALDKASGKEKWRVARDEATSWATPLVVTAGGQAQVIANATRAIRSYALADGRELWSCTGMTANAIPTPVEHAGLVICMSGFRGNAIRAIRLDGASGDVSDSPAVVWKSGEPGTPYVPSPVLVDGKLYYTEHNKALLSCLDATTGQVHYTKQRIDGPQGIYASPVVAGGRIYILGRDGQTAVIQPGPEFKQLGVNKLDDGFESSPAIAGDEIFLRGHEFLYCIAGK